MREALRKIKRVLTAGRVPPPARAALRRIRREGLLPDPGPEAALRAAAAWLARAQDRSASADGGVARDYSLVSGWSTSYPETTGYIVPTALALEERLGLSGWADRARRMLDWLLTVQHPAGGFPGGVVGALSPSAVTFNTGQILLGLAAGARRWGEPYRAAMARAADWLAADQDADGCWRRSPTPFAAPGEKTYETHVAWGLIEAAAGGEKREWLAAAERNLEWALTQQRPNGWLANCCLSDPRAPLTHTIGYALRGLVEGYRATGREDLLRAAVRTATGVAGAVGPDGFLPGRLAHDWSGAVRWACLTGSAQLAASLLELGGWTGAARLTDAGRRLNSYVRRTQRPADPDPGVAGGIAGSWPINGEYGRFQYLNWAAKFFLDANLAEMHLGPAPDSRG